MLTSLRLNKLGQRQQQQKQQQKQRLPLVDPLSHSGGNSLQYPLLQLAGCLLLVAIISALAISRAHSSNLIASKQHASNTSSLPNNDNQHLIDSTTTTTTTTATATKQRHPQATNNHKPQRQQQHNNNDNLFKQHRHQQHRRPHSSSSSTSSLIEDLNDSTIKTRFGIVDRDELPEQLEFKPSGDFEQLIERLLRPLAASAQKGAQFPSANQLQPGQLQPLMVPADPNNKTTMRFFRNNKTFASIVYTNEHLDGPPAPDARADASQTPEPANGVAPTPGTSKKNTNNNNNNRRKLINCHLVDLEKHSSDVDVFESKYRIKTIDVEFKEMMQLIDACTDIARFRSVKPPALSLGPNGQPTSVQLFAAALPKMSPSSASSLSSSSSSPPPPLHQSTAATVTQQQQQQQLQKVVNELKSLALVAGDPSSASAALGKPPATSGGASPPGAATTVTTRKRRLLKMEAPPPVQRLELVSKLALGRLGRTSKKLVLGEVTPLPGLVESRPGGIKEALQEITSYDTTDLLAIWRGILPGTNWCGMGDRATSYNDLGFESDIDICCRAHDFCPIRLSAFSAGYGLFNWSFYTRSHCWCDQNFLDCLQRAQSPLSAVVMKFYFTIMKTTCLHDNETISADPSFYTAAAARQQHLTPASISWWSLGGGGLGRDTGTGTNRWPGGSATGNKQPPQSKQQQSVPVAVQQQHQSQSQPSPEQEHKMLLEQIRAKMPIAALKLSQALASKLDIKPSVAAPASTVPLRATYK